MDSCSVLLHVRFYLVRVFAKVGKILCSVCSVDFVEKMWRSMRESLCRSLGKSFHRMVNFVVLHILEWDFTHFGGVCGKFCRWFYTRFYICKSGGFAHFPQCLLLQLLNIL